MANYHLNVKIIQRSKGQNAVASAAYRRAAKLFEEKEGRHYNYTSKPNVIHSELMIPEMAANHLKDLIELHTTDPSKAAEMLWNCIEAGEMRKDSQLAREIEFSLPIELTKDQNIVLAREFIHDQFVLRGMIADWSVHWDEGNPHVHVMLTMRELTPDGFGEKVTAWNKAPLLCEWRLQWAEYANFHLRLHRHDVSIDHRSYQERGIDLVPTVHLGKAVMDMHHRGIDTNLMKEANEICQENLVRIAADPSIILNKLSTQSGTFTDQQLGQELGRYLNDQGQFSHDGQMAQVVLENLKEFEDPLSSLKVLTPDSIAKILTSIEYHESVFTERMLAKAVEPFTQNADQFAKAILQIKTSSDLIHLGAGEDGRDRYTTRKMFRVENEIQHLADVMRDRRHVKVSEGQKNRILEQHQNLTGKRLTEEQRAAVQHILKSSSISCIVGRAGTGKSFSLGTAKGVWEASGLRVQGVTLSGVAADGLSHDSGIPSRTIESFRYAIEKGTLTLNHQDVVVMDEAGMTDSLSMFSVLKTVQEAKAKLVLVGDHAQLQPVGPGASFRALLERLGFAEIQTVYRQHEPWQRAATVHFSSGRVADGLAAYEAHNCIHFATTQDEAQQQLVTDWVKARANGQNDLSQMLVIAHRNKDVNALNTQLRSERVKQGEIAEGYTVRGKHDEMKVAQGDRILFLKNDRRLGVSNGRFATITDVNFTESGRVNTFTIIPDGSERSIVINPDKYRDFAYGYAATVHKVQGKTVDHAFVYAGGSFWNRHLTYVALSRHRESCQLYAAKDSHQSQGLLQRNLGRLAIKDSLLDFSLGFAERRGIDTSGSLERLPLHLGQRLKTWKNKIADHCAWFINPEQQAQECHLMAQEKLKAEQGAKRREDARVVATYVDHNRDVGMAWKSLKSKLEAVGPNDASHESTLLQVALRERGKSAHQIMSNLPLYEKALEIYNLDHQKLKNQSDHYIEKNTMQKREATKGIRSEITMNELLTQYVDMELEQTRLVTTMQSTRLKDPEHARVLSEKAVAHSGSIRVFASNAIQHPEIKSEIEKLKMLRPASLAQRGGFSGIHGRTKAGKWSVEDVQTVLVQLRGKAQELSRSRSEDRDRGGRSH